MKVPDEKQQASVLIGLVLIRDLLQVWVVVALS